MDFWSEFSKTITTAADQTVKGAEKLTDMAKIKYRIAGLNSKLDEVYRTLGKLRVAEAEGETVGEEAYAPLIESATELKAQLAMQEEALHKLRGDVNCPQCGNRVKRDANFCPKCGESMKPEQQD